MMKLAVPVAILLALVVVPGPFSNSGVASSLAIIGSKRIADGTNVNTIHSAPYFMPLDDAPDIDDILNRSTLRHFILAFVLATNDGRCVPTWNGLADRTVADDRTVAIMVEKIRSRGGDVSVSFGGYNGVELTRACQTVDQLADAYQTVIDKYGLTHVDFDIEGDDLGVPVEETRRFAAIKRLKETARQRGRKLIVSLTLPTTIVGTNDAGKEEIRRGLEQQADIDLYTLMTFDFGGQANTQAQQVITVMESFHQQLRSLLPGSESEIYRQTGMILMNGHTDQPSELYTAAVFRDLMHYANQHQLARVSFWSINRDRECPADRTNIPWAVSFCSSVRQEPYEFSRILATFNQNNNDNDNNRHHTETMSTSTRAPDPVPDGDVDCSKVDTEQFFPYHGDRHKYIWCYEGKRHILTCPAGLIFNVNIHACDWDHQQPHQSTNDDDNPDFLFV